MFELAEIDRGLFEALRLAVVSLGYLPDRTLYSTLAAYELAKQAIKGTGKELIDVFGVGNYKNRYALQNNKIVIDRTANRRGAVGGAMLTMYTPTSNPDKFDEWLLPKQTRDIDYIITYVCSSTQYDRILYSIVTDTLRDKSSIKGVKEDGSFTEQSFFLVQTSESDSSDGEYIERKFSYTVENVYVGKPILKQAGVSRVKRIEVEVRGGYSLHTNQLGGTVVEEF